MAVVFNKSLIGYHLPSDYMRGAKQVVMSEGEQQQYIRPEYMHYGPLYYIGYTVISFKMTREYICTLVRAHERVHVRI